MSGVATLIASTGQKKNDVASAKYRVKVTPNSLQTNNLFLPAKWSCGPPIMVKGDGRSRFFFFSSQSMPSFLPSIGHPGKKLSAAVDLSEHLLSVIRSTRSDATSEY